MSSCRNYDRPIVVVAPGSENAQFPPAVFVVVDKGGGGPFYCLSIPNVDKIGNNAPSQLNIIPFDKTIQASCAGILLPSHFCLSNIAPYSLNFWIVFPSLQLLEYQTYPHDMQVL